jgi:hypothetical protein
MHAHDQRAKDAQATAQSSRLKTPIIVPSFKQKRLQFDIIRGPIDIPRDVQLREEQRLEDEDDGANELLLDALIGDAYGDNEALDVRMTYQEVLDDVDIKLARTDNPYTSRIVADLHLLRQYTQQLLKLGQYWLGRIDASLLVASSNHRFNDGKTLARRIRGLFNYYRQWHGVPQEARGGKRDSASYLDNEDVFLAYRTWLINQELGTISLNDFLNTVN